MVGEVAYLCNILITAVIGEAIDSNKYLVLPVVYFDDKDREGVP